MSVEPHPDRPAPRRPPYLLTAATGRDAPVLGIVADPTSAVVELAVRGPWSRRLGRRLAEVLRLCLAGPSTSIIVDLSALGDHDGISTPFWSAVLRGTEFGPDPDRVTFCLPAPTSLHELLRHADGRRPLLFATLPEARAAAAERQVPDHRLQARLLPEPASVAAARGLVAEACRDWSLSSLLYEAQLIMSELATNAVTHARTELVATVARGRSGLHLAVRDGTTTFPGLPERPHRGQLGGRGLLMVHAAAAAWGAMPTRDGKVVWATLTA